MPSANGQKIEVTRSNGDTYTLVAAWRAPFLVIVDMGEGRPLLYHAENHADALAFARTGGGRISILDDQFIPTPKGTEQ